MIYKFTTRAKKALEFAEEIAKELKHNFIGTEHILYGLVREGNGIASKVLEAQGITGEKIKNQIIELIGIGEKTFDRLGFTPRTKKVLENSFLETKKFGYDYIGTEHLLIGLLREEESIAGRILINLNVNLSKIYSEISNVVSEIDKATGYKSSGVKNNKSKLNTMTPTLNQYGDDLTEKAMFGKIDPVVGRKDEIQRIIQILSRRSKNNPCLVGETGVGKTAIIEGLAQQIYLGEVPEMIKFKRIVSLDISGMVAGAKYRGDFEDRIKKVLNEVKKMNNIILFIDEIHTIVGAGSAEGAIDAANILKPLLARGEIQLIGATTIAEYRKYIEKDAALERRFSSVNIPEPSVKDTELILKGIRDSYEAHHNVKITDEAIDTAIKLSVRYINDRFLPDKAIDLIDEAASKVRLKSFIEPELLKKLQSEIQSISKDKEEAIRSQKFEKAAELRDKEIDLKEKFEIEEEKWKSKSTKKIINIYGEDIEEVVSKWSGIPVEKINESENKRLNKLEEELHRRVIGQDDAINTLAKAIRRNRVGLGNPNKPIGSFLFLGPTGVGKTELSKALAEILFGEEKDLIRLDMSEYMEAHSVSKIIGAPPGYIGFDEGGQLTEMVRTKPYSVILFDEIEKAHRDVMNILLQILDDGRVSDSTGRVVNFKNTVIIMTSNIGARIITDKKMLGFSNEKNEDDSKIEYENIKRDVEKELKKEFRPEFLNRIDEIIVFNKLNDKEFEQIIDIMLKDVQERLSEQNYIVEFEPEINEYILNQGINKAFGARPLRRAIQNHIEDNLADLILNGKMKKNKKIVLGVEDDKIIIK